MLYRSRLGNDLGGITLDFVSSVSDDSEIAIYDILGSQAHVIMLYENDLITAESAKRILGALLEIKDAGPVVDGSEDIHEQIEAAVIKRAGPEHGGRMHTARSRNDQVALDMRMKMRDDINIACGCLLDAIEALVSLADRHKKTVMPLYTHLQQAQAGTFSHYLLAHADALLRDLERLSEVFARVNQSPLGAGPVGGTSLPIDRNTTAKLLGFCGLVENSLDATSARDFVAEYMSAICIMMTNMSRLAEDFVIWSSTEFSFIELADEFASPSSVMPQKKNPDVMELVRGKTARATGGLVGVLSSLKGLASGYGRDLQEIKSPVWGASRDAIGALVMVKSVLLTLYVNEKAMAKAARGGYLVALDIAEKLVQRGVPFRTAHKITGRLVQQAHESKKPLNKITPGEIEGVDSGVIAEILHSVTVSSSLRDRTSQGSSGFAEQRRMIRARKKTINARRTEITRRDNEISNSLDELSRRVKELTE